MDALAEARRRLEGSLEELERATLALEAAQAALGGRSPAGVSAAVRLAEQAKAARGRVERLASSLPALRPVLARFDRADVGLQAALGRRGRLLRLGTTAPLAIAEGLEAEPVLWEGRAIAPSLVFVAALIIAIFAALGVWVVVTGATAPHPLLLVVGGAIGLNLARQALWPPRVVVTRARVLSGAVELKPVATRRLALRYASRDGGDVLLEYERGRGDGENIRFVQLPRALRLALREMALPPSETGLGK